jgi:hypothetical protein
VFFIWQYITESSLKIRVTIHCIHLNVYLVCIPPHITSAGEYNMRRWPKDRRSPRKRKYQARPWVHREGLVAMT